MSSMSKDWRESRKVIRLLLLGGDRFEVFLRRKKEIRVKVFGRRRHVVLLLIFDLIVI